MDPQGRHHYRSAVPVVPRILDVLHAKRRINPAPYVNGIVALNNVLAPVVQTAIAQKKSRATECEIFLVVPRDAVRNENQSGTVEFPVPPSTAAGNAYFLPSHPLRCRRTIHAVLRSIPTCRTLPSSL